MSSKETILNELKNTSVFGDTSKPSFNLTIEKEDKYSDFKTQLEAVGAIVVEAETFTSAASKLSSLENIRNAKQTFSNVESLYKGNTNLDDISDGHNLKDMDVAIVRGEIGVAENGAIWLDATNFAHRSIFFITQHLVIAITKADLVNDMHEAYSKIDFSKVRNGYFISGPSKTADIEQSLVIGAHGARSCVVVLTDSE